MRYSWVTAGLAVFHATDRDGLLVEALLRAAVPVDGPADAQDHCHQEGDSAEQAFVATRGHGCIPSARLHEAAILQCLF
jgi:hypothetical protein